MTCRNGGPESTARERSRDAEGRVMRKHKVETAALEVATQVRTVEDVIENALEELAVLQMRMVQARAAAGVATATGHDAFKHLAGALHGLIEARGGVADCHA